MLQDRYRPVMRAGGGGGEGCYKTEMATEHSECPESDLQTPACDICSPQFSAVVQALIWGEQANHSAAAALAPSKVVSTS